MHRNMEDLSQVLKDGYIPMSSFLELIEIENYAPPYKTEFSLELYLRTLSEKQSELNNPILQSMGEVIRKAEKFWIENGIKNCPFLHSKDSDILFPSLFFQEDLSFISKPFNNSFIKVTKAMEAFLSDENWEMYLLSRFIDKNKAIVGIGSFILSQCYGFDDFDLFNDQIQFRNSKTRLLRFEEVNIKTPYVEVIQTKPLLPLSDDEIRNLLENTTDIQLWLDTLPPDRFLIRGFVFGTLHDVTKINIHSLMHREIANIGDTQHPLEKMSQINRLFKSYLKDSDIKVGLANLKYIDLIDSGSMSISLTQEIDIRKISSSNTIKGRCLYSDAIYHDKTVIYDDLGRKSPLAPAEQLLLKNQIKSIALIPVKNEQGKLISILEIGSKSVHGVNNIVLMRLEQMIELMKLMIISFTNETERKVTMVIRDHFTSIHPSVEWKFRNAATKYQINMVNGVDSPTMDEIKFESVYPLYGQADIVGSSMLRAEVLKSDLEFNLKSLITLINTWHEEKNLFLLGSYKLKLEELLEKMSTKFDSSDESIIIDMLHNDVHPLLKELKNRHDSLSDEPYNEYIAILDKDLGIVYDKRKLFDESVNKINLKLSEFFHEADREMQKTLPHFFEKYKTDGVEYSIYIGGSILENGQFSENDLKEFRLWQLKIMVDATRLVHDLTPTLDIPITTAQLIFVYNNELNIKFRMEEKKFDVDGAYNVRFEILKKRIDKATIKGTNDRLTHKDKISIVYLHEKEKREYSEYINYLRHANMITDEVEYLDLNHLPGADGLKAIRIAVKF